MEWVKGEDLLQYDESVSCCDKGSKVIFVCLSTQCRQKQRLVCKRCSTVHSDHQQELVEIKRFALETSSRHETARKLQLYDSDEIQSGPTNSIDSIIQTTFAREKNALQSRMQAIQDRLISSLKKKFGHVEAFLRTRENVIKLDKKKKYSLMTIPSQILEMIIDVYWGLDQKSAERYTPDFLQSEVESCVERIGSTLRSCFLSIDEEVDKCLGKVSYLLKGERLEQLGKEESKSQSHLHFNHEKKCGEMPKRKFLVNFDDVEMVFEKANQHFEKVSKDVQDLKDNKVVLLNENSNLTDLSERCFSEISEKIELKKDEISRLEKSKDLPNLYIARNQLSTLIRMQVQQYKQLNAQRLRVDSRMMCVMKNIENKQEELSQSKVILRKASLSRSSQKSVGGDEQKEGDSNSLIGEHDSFSIGNFSKVLVTSPSGKNRLNMNHVHRRYSSMQQKHLSNQSINNNGSLPSQNSTTFASTTNSWNPSNSMSEIKQRNSSSKKQLNRNTCSIIPSFQQSTRTALGFSTPNRASKQQTHHF